MLCSPTEPAVGTRPSTITWMTQPRHDKVSGMLLTFLQDIGICRTNSPVTMPSLLMTATSSTCQNQEKKASRHSSNKSMGSANKVTLILWVPIYSVYIYKAFIVMPANFWASCSSTNRMSYMAFNLWTRTLGWIWRLFWASSMDSLLMPINCCVATFVINWEIIIFSTASKVSSNLLPLVKGAYFSWRAQ